MKLIIDIPEDRYDEIHSLKFVMYGLQSEENRKLFYRLINAVQDSTPIPDNATNGDMIKAIFSSIDFTEMAFTVHATTSVTSNGVKGSISYDFWKDWWNAPYKTEK